MTTALVPAERRQVAERDRGHLVPLDGVRTVAVLFVIATHTASETGNATGSAPIWSVLDNGTVGVPIFFVLSGLLLYRPWARVLTSGGAVPNVRRYLRRRALRILPAYWLALLVILPLANPGHASSPRTWLEMATLTQSYDPSPWWGDGLGPDRLGPMWSLSVEVTFYLLLPVLAWLVAKLARGRPGWALGWLGALTAAFFLATYAIRAYGNYRLSLYWEHVLPRLLPYFLIGMAITLALEGTRGVRVLAWAGQLPGVCWTVAGCAMLLVATPLATAVAGGGQTPWQALVMIVLFGLAAAALILPVAVRPDEPLVRAVLGNKAVSRIGLVSYGIFLWHDAVLGLWLRAARHLGQADNAPLALAVTLGVSLLVAEASYRLVEHPLSRWRSA